MSIKPNKDEIDELLNFFIAQLFVRFNCVPLSHAVTTACRSRMLSDENGMSAPGCLFSIVDS